MSRRGLTAFTDADFEEADRLDELLGISRTEDVRRHELMKVVQCLAESDRLVADVRVSMADPYWAFLRLKLLARRSAKGIARVNALNEQLNALFDDVASYPGSRRAAEFLRDRRRLYLEVETELVATLSPGRRAVVDSLRDAVR